MHSGGLRSHSVERKWQVQKDLRVKRKWKTTRRSRTGHSGRGGVCQHRTSKEFIRSELEKNADVSCKINWLNNYWQSSLSVWCLFWVTERQSFEWSSTGRSKVKTQSGLDWLYIGCVVFLEVRGKIASIWTDYFKICYSAEVKHCHGFISLIRKIYCFPRFSRATSWMNKISNMRMLPFDLGFWCLFQLIIKNLNLQPKLHFHWFFKSTVVMLRSKTPRENVLLSTYLWT